MCHSPRYFSQVLHPLGRCQTRASLATARIRCAGNDIGAEGCKAFCEALKTNKTLKSVELGGMAVPCLRHAHGTRVGGGGD